MGLRWACFVALILSGSAARARAEYTPDSPEVKAAVAKGLKFLEGELANESRVGGKAVAALALLKNNAPPNHPKVLEAVDAIRAGLKDNVTFLTDIYVYNQGLSIIFLVNADPKKYRSEIQQLLKIQGQTQKPHGGWGYNGSEFGDTSMTQYSVLSMWEAAEAGFDIPIERWEKVCNWLMRTQDPSGAFGYQAVDAGSFNLVPQNETRLSMCAAGSGSLYICGDHFGLVDLGPKSKDDEVNVPDALKPAGGAARRRGDAGAIDKQVFLAARERADKHLDGNYAIKVPLWQYYYLYAYERYQSFREAAEGRIGQPSQWYDDGVKFLLAEQTENGAWIEQCGATADTAFAVLFLVRSTRKSITRARYFGGGTLVGGRGLPHGEGLVHLRSGRVKRRPLSGPAEQLFAAIDSADNETHFRAVEDLEELAAAGDAAELDAQALQLRKLVAEGAPEARVAAVRALGRTRNLDHVPTLIAALSDEDAEVYRETVAALRFMSRRFSDAIVPATPSAAQRQAEIQQWREWYLSVRPLAKLES